MNLLVEQFHIDLKSARQLPLFEPRYNIAPTQDVLVVREEESGEREAAIPLEAAQRVPDQAASLPHPPAGVVENRHSAPLQEPSTRLPGEERLGR